MRRDALGPRLSPVRFSSQDPSHLPTAKLTFIVYDDLSFEGSAKAGDELFKRREELAKEMAFSNAVRAELPKLPPDQLHSVVVAKRAERLKQLVVRGRAPQLSELEQMIEQATQSPEQFQQVAPARIDEVERQRERLLRHRRLASRHAVDATRSANEHGFCCADSGYAWLR